MAEYAKKESLISVLPPRLGHGDVYALGYNTCRNLIEMIIKDFPAADVVPVVRCKDCKNWDKERKYCHHPAGMSFCGKKGAKEGFCCFGERRGDE